jgi:hypothetical protein
MSDYLVSLGPSLFQAGAGGFLLSFMNLYEDSRRAVSDRVPKDGYFWLFFGFWPIAGALLAYIYVSSGYKIDGMLAFTLGLSAPTTIQALMQKAVTNRPPKDAEE